MNNIEKTLTEKVTSQLIKLTYTLPPDVKKSLHYAYKKERKPLAKFVLKQLIENYKIAEEKKFPLCQDTGTIIFFVKVGIKSQYKEINFEKVLNTAIKNAYRAGFLRSSIVKDPLRRENTGDNTPGIIHYEITSGNKVVIEILAKGGGAENVSTLEILPPSLADEKTIITKVINWIKKNAIKACPPIVVGIGIGGTFDYAPLLAKKALLRKIGSINKDKFYAGLERKILEKINKTGIGPQGVGGKTTALAVFINSAPVHITSLPLAININCHSIRRGKVVL